LELGLVLVVLFLEVFGFVVALFLVVALGFDMFRFVDALWPPFIDLLGCDLDGLGLDIERPPPLEAP
jgi:hypothetical protein